MTHLTPDGSRKDPHTSPPTLDDADTQIVSGAGVPTAVASQAAALEVGAEALGSSAHPATNTFTDVPTGRKRLKPGYLTALFLAQLTLYIAWIAPTSFSLAIRVAQVDPAGKDVALALAIGIPGIIVVFSGPFLGVLSDRTRSRLGRRRPWLLGGTILGLSGTTLVAFAPGLPLVIGGWVIAYVGYSMAGAMILAHLGDKLPENQRGKVTGVNGAITQIGPIMGIMLAGALAASPEAMFLIPATAAFLGGMLFFFVMRDESPIDAPGAFDLKGLLAGFWFNPRRLPDFGWVWLSRAFIFVSLSLSQLYGVYLLTERLGLTAAEIAAIVGIAGLLGVVLSIFGALLSGLLSDRLQNRKGFLISSALLMAIGFIVTATTASVVQYVVGGLIMAFGIGIYGAVDQATAFDVIPQEGTENGRYLAIFGLASTVPQAAGPFLAGAVVTLAGGNYSAVYVVAAVTALLGALAIIPLTPLRKLRAARAAAAATASV